jgi:hypothetical protein
MPALTRASCIVVLAVAGLSARAFAQNPPALVISPEKASMIVGETRTFRAVGKDGRIRHNVRWSISPDSAATLTLNGDEATVQAKQASSKAYLTAHAESDSAEATIEILSSGAPPAGTVLWTVPPIPGCKSAKLTQAVPSATGPDLYDQEECPQGTVIRALTADGREIWRKQISGTGSAFTVDPAQAKPESGERLNPKATSVCDAVSSGMAKEEVSTLLTTRNLHLDGKQRQSDDWTVEEEGFRCTISFDGKTETVVKKKKTIVSD